MAEIMDPFGQFAEKYDQWYDENHWVFQSEIFAIERLLPRRVKALEVGVGTGRFASAFGISLGIDPSPPMLEIARKRNITTVQGVAEALPFRDVSMHLVLMVFTICFVQDLKKSLDEAFRTLMPNGQLVIGFIDKLSPLGKQYQRDREKSNYFRQAIFYSPEELTELLQQALFQDIFFVQTLFNPLEKIDRLEPVKNGYGHGSFLVVRGIRP